jgi:hypothetical protein
MKNHRDALAGVAAAIFLILVAWGNALAMLLVSAAALGIWAGACRGNLSRRGLAVGMAAFGVAATVGAVLASGCL